MIKVKPCVKGRRNDLAEELEDSESNDYVLFKIYDYFCLYFQYLGFCVLSFGDILLDRAFF